MKEDLEIKLYERTKIKYEMEDGSTFFSDGSEGVLENGDPDPALKFKSKKVIYSRYFTKEHGEPNKSELKDLKDGKKNSNKSYKLQRAEKMKKFEYILIGFVGFIIFKLLLPENSMLIEERLSQYIPNVIPCIYYMILFVCYFLISNLKRNVIAFRRKTYRNHIILLYLEKIYSHLTNQDTTTSKKVTYDKDGFPINLYSSSLIDLVTISIGQTFLILFMIIGYFLFKF